MDSLSGAREFYDPGIASNFGASHVPSQPSTIPSPRTMLPGLILNFTGNSANVLKGRPSSFFNPKNLASSSQELRTYFPGKTKQLDSKMGREPQNSSIPVPRFQGGGGLLNHTGGTYSHS